MGVRVLSLYVASRIFQEYKTGDEELFVQVFENKINNDNIESVFQIWEFWRFLDNQYARISDSDIPTRMAVDTVRAFIGSVYIDGGYDAVQSIIAQLLYARPSADYGTPPVVCLGIVRPTKKSSLNDSPPDDAEEWPALRDMRKDEGTQSPQPQKKSYLQASQRNESTQKASPSQPNEEWPVLNNSPIPFRESPKWPILMQPSQKKELKKNKNIIFHGVWKN